jgi:phosphoglycerate dehydrogenase-like enzyme
MNKRIVAVEPIGQTAIDILERVAPVEIAEATDERTLLSTIQGTIGFVFRGQGRVSERLLGEATELKVIGRTGAGLDNVDLSAATARGTPVVYAPVSGFAVAEGALAMLLALIKQLAYWDRFVKSGRWNEKYGSTTGDMAEHTLGIVGMGRIGRHMARLAHPFGMRILGYDPYIDDGTGLPDEFQTVGLEELLAASDYVSLHTPLTDETRGLIDEQRLSAIKTGAILINTARGGLIQSLDVLADALESGRLGGVGLDVFPTEPPDPTHRIFQHPRCICAPHLVGGSRLAMHRILHSMATDMVRVINGNRPQHCANPEVFD